ncbi:SAM-dependent methyltransferase [Vitreoscilla massiliensis]|uniref:SAM-dependent methyltransferase n=1 Tax=Vitreoscilla massiliensis TaxID=1689272 RepID=A0ABY4DY94_9NEIS|nr:SAM-dependent methyltransferase [Vitreoscilla massiliensis]UOO88100.1 SAM-dependent methyltransferase [Vitreoscilla massiliensis]
MNKNLPLPDAAAEQSSLALQQLIANEIQCHRNWISFHDYMQLALFAPNLGYYTGGSHKIGSAGDFVTAPSLTPLFGLTLARQIEPLLKQTAGNVYEFGAGTGELAVSLLAGLNPDVLQHYYIMDVSPELKQRQLALIQAKQPQFADKVVFLDSLPSEFDGVIIGNEVLDAMASEVVRWTEQGVMQMGVSIVDDVFAWQERPVNDERILAEALRINPDKRPFTSELHLNQAAFIATLAQKLTRGAIIMIDYGFDEGQYYHPQRSMGTLIGHYRHHVVDDPFFWPGLMDLTCHVNFTAMAQAAVDSDLDLIGYTSQAHFLFNLGITEVLLAEHPDINSKEYLQAASAMQKLVAPHEMGELFKVIAMGRNVDVDWQGFVSGDWCHKL